jgi:type VI secretion system secreted protein VgrG
VKVDLPAFPDAGRTGGAGHLGWVPVAERAAGATVQTLSVPEVGEVVLVAFEGGNTDRPVIAGRLFSGGEMPPLPLPEQKTTSVLANRGNEVVMDGKTGAELLRINGRGDVALESGRDLRIGTGEEIVVRGGQTIAIETGASIVLRAGNQSITISPEGITLTRTPQIVPSGTEKTALPALKRP